MAEQKLDCRGMQCPGPIMAVAKALKEAAVGDELVVEVTEKSFAKDVESLCRKLGQELVSLDKGDTVVARIKKVK